MKVSDVRTGNGKPFGAWLKDLVVKNNTYLMLAVLVLVSMMITPDFLSRSNIINISRQYAGLIVVSLGMLFVILTGGIDLSVGSMVALGSVTTGLLLSRDYGMPVAIAITVLVGAVAGMVSGFFVAKVKMPSFIVTLAMMTIAKGLAFMFSNGSPIPTPPNSVAALGRGSFIGIPYLVYLAAAFILVAYFVLTRTSFGRLVIATGSNETCVRLSGIRVDIIKNAVYVISGSMAAIGGIIAASRTGVGTPLYGAGMELDAIAACVIGGASLSGGEGNAVKVVVGVLVLALIGNIMNLLSVPSYPQDVIKGIIIIAAALLQNFTSSRKSASF